MHTFYLIIKRNIANIPFRHFPKTHCSIVPLFQHSKWDEAPKFNYCLNTLATQLENGNIASYRVLKLVTAPPGSGAAMQQL